MLNILFISSFLALAVTSIPLWLNAFARIRSTGSVLETRKTQGSPFGFIDIIVMFFCWFLGQSSSIGIAIFVLDLDTANLQDVSGGQLAWMTILTAMGNLAATLIAMSVLLVRYRSLSVFGWQPKYLRRDLVLGLMSFLMVVPSILIVQFTLTQIIDYQHSTLEMLAANSDVLTIAASWFGAVLIAPICEEIFFRGVVQAWLQRLSPGRVFSDPVLTGGWDSIEPDDADETSGTAGQAVWEHGGKPTTPSDVSVDAAMGQENLDPYRSPRLNPAASTFGRGFSATSDSVWPIVVSAAIFGLAHAGQGPAPIPLFLFGLALGYLYRKTGSIVPCILLHMLLNGYSMFWFTLQVLFHGTESTPPNEVANLVERASQFVSMI